MNTTVLQPVYRHRGPLLLINPDHPLSDEPSQHELYPIPPKQNRVFLERQTSVMLTKLLSEIGVQEIHGFVWAGWDTVHVGWVRRTGDGLG